MNTAEFVANSSAFSLAELAPYFEQHVAWSADGKKILAHAKEPSDLYKEVDRLGLKNTDYVFGFVADPEIVDLGGAGLE